MKKNILGVRQHVVIVRQFKGIGITEKLQGYYIPDAKPLVPRFYNARIVFQYKSLRVGLTTLRKQPPCSISLTIDEPVLPF